MELLSLCVIFGVIVILLWMKKPLFLALGASIFAGILLFRIPPMEAAAVLCRQSLAADTWNILLSFYSITLLQRMLEQRQRLQQAQTSFNALLRNRRMNAAISTTVLGLLPSAAVMSVCASMVDHTCKGYLDKREKMLVACYYRHIPEMFLPTFSSILMALGISGVSAGKFVLSMFPMVLTAYGLLYVVYLRRMPPEMPLLEVSRREELCKLLKNLWSFLAILLLSIVWNLSVYMAALPVLALDYIVDRFRPEELPALLKSAAEPLLLGNMYLVMLFKGIIAHTNVIVLLPDFFGRFPIPITAAFGLIFFFATVVSGSQATIALCLPMALSAIPDGGISLLVLLMCVTWAAMQVSPTHVCNFVAAKYFQTTLGDLVVRGLPILVLFCIIAYGYSSLLAALQHLSASMNF